DQRQHPILGKPDNPNQPNPQNKPTPTSNDENTTRPNDPGTKQPESPADPSSPADRPTAPSAQPEEQAAPQPEVAEQTAQPNSSGPIAGGLEGILRHLQKTVATAYMELQGVANSDPIAEALANAPTAQFGRLFGQLRTTQQAALILRYRRGKSETETAQVLNTVAAPAKALGDVATRTLTAGAVRRLARSVATECGVPNTNDNLTPNEIKILKLLTQGLTAKEIAETVGSSPRTVTGVTDGIIMKFGTANKVAVVAEAIRRGVLDVLHLPSTVRQNPIALASDETTVLIMNAKGMTREAIAETLTDSWARQVSPGQVKAIMDRIGRAFGIPAGAGSLVPVGLREGIIDFTGPEWSRWNTPDDAEKELSGREITVLELLVRGMTNPMIAKQLHASVGFVATCRHRIYRKLGVSAQADLKSAARYRGIAIDDGPQYVRPILNGRQITLLRLAATGMTYDDIAADQEITAGAVKISFIRIRKRLDSAVGEDLVRAARDKGIDLGIETPADASVPADDESPTGTPAELSQPTSAAPSAEQRFVDWFRGRKAGQGQNLADYMKMHHLLPSQVNRWLSRAGLESTEPSSPLPTQFPSPVGMQAPAWLAAVRRYLGVPAEQIDELIGAPTGTWQAAQRGRSDLEIAHVRALLRRVPGARAAYPDAARLFPELLTATGRAAYPEGYELIGKYFQFVRDYHNNVIGEFFLATREFDKHDIYSRPSVAALGTFSANEYYLIEHDRVHPSKDTVDSLMAVMPPPHGVTRDDLSECYSELPRESLIFPGTSATESFGEYLRYFRGVNNLARGEAAGIFGLSGHAVHMHQTGGTQQVEELQMLHHYDHVLHKAGPWNDLAAAWGYTYRMNPAGETDPDAAEYKTLYEWIRAERLYRRMTLTQFDAQVGSAGLWRNLDSKGYTRRLVTIRKIRDKLGIPNETVTAVITNHYRRSNLPAVDTADDRLIWDLIAAPVGSPEEEAARNPLVEKYAWIATAAANRWRNADEYDDLVQRGLQAIIVATGYIVPGTSFPKLAWSHVNFKMRDAYVESRQADANKESRELLRTVKAYIGQYANDNHREPDNDEIAAATDLTISEVIEARDILRHGMDSLDAPITESGMDLHDLPAQSIFVGSDHPSFGDPQFDEADNSQFEDAVAEALADLPDSARAKELVMLHFVDGCPLGEVAERLGIALPAAEQLRDQTIGRLQTAFADRWHLLGGTATPQNQNDATDDTRTEPDNRGAETTAQPNEVQGTTGRRTGGLPANPLPPGVELFHDTDPNPLDEHFPHTGSANKRRNLNNEILEFHHQNNGDDHRFWDQPEPAPTPDTQPGTTNAAASAATGGPLPVGNAAPAGVSIVSVEDRFLEWCRARLSDESGQPGQNLADYIAMHHLEMGQVRRWLTNAGLDATALDNIASEPFPVPVGSDKAVWLAAARRYLAVSPERMDELLGATSGTWQAAEQGQNELEIAQVRALLRRVPGARDCYRGAAACYPGLLDADGKPEYPEGYSAVGEYLRYHRNSEGLTQRRYAELTGSSKLSVTDRETGKKKPSQAALLSIAAALPFPHGVTYEEIAENFPYLPRATLLFPAFAATTSFGEYLRYFGRLNHLEKWTVGTVLELPNSTVRDHYNDASETLEDLVVLDFYTRGLHRAGPWNDLAEAWGYSYRMDRGGETIPDPAEYDLHNWVKAARLYRRLPQHELSALTGQSQSSISQFETGSRPDVTFLRTLRDALDIPNEVLVEVLRRHYSHDVPAGDATEEQLFWELIATRPGSDDEKNIRGRICEKYVWVAQTMAKRWRIPGEQFDDLRNIAFAAILVATKNFVPPGDFAPAAWSAAHHAIRRAFFEYLYPKVDRETRHQLMRVQEYVSRRSSATMTESDVAEVAMALDLDPAEVTELLTVLGYREIRTDEPIKGKRGTHTREFADQRAELPFDMADFMDVLSTAVADMPDSDRVQQVMEFLFVDGYTEAEIAGMLRMKLATVRRMSAAAIERLRITVERDNLSDRPDESRVIGP
ncbi:sigma-70 family RNA polymerase sigma factor, partial [Nocardia pseudovaccinii]|uniref:sigma-70 family RNA polymerase sigma factor n=1 Tax=Nocardia pseudovaccinii TaxID=189540 RepID=UPI000A9D86A5